MLTNLDDDSPAITISAKKNKLKPSDNETVVSVVLSTQPSGEVPVSLDVSEYNAVETVPETLTFDAENWNVPQNVTLKYSHPEAVDRAITDIRVMAFSEVEDGEYVDLVSNYIVMDLYAYDVLDFEYKGAEDHIQLLPGEYNIQVWGAQGAGSLNMTGGYGGYSYGTVEFKELTDVYINVGGIPYNGGGVAQANGGGATHIATVSGLLSTLSEVRDKVLIVAGGGGGSERTLGGYGGGETGGIGNDYTYTTKIPTGGTQTEGGERGETSMYGVGDPGKFGQGGDGQGQIMYDVNPNPHLDPGSGGGGGWYGGGGIPYAGGGGGGSGHIGVGVTGETVAGNQQFESPTGGTETGHAGTGFARITIIEREIPQVN